MKKPVIILVDGKWMAYRAHYAHMQLKTSGGRPSGLVFGFLKELLAINKRKPACPIIICWDGNGETWRHRAYPAYKANRTENPDWKIMKAQIDELLPTLQVGLGMHVARVDGVEADDIIGILAHHLKVTHNVVVYSADRDMYQLVGDSVKVWQKLEDRLWGQKDVQAWLGAPISAFVEIKAMAGDPADNLKGLPGIGFKKALKLYSSGFGMYGAANIALWDKYAKDLPRLKQELRLVRIVTDCDSKAWNATQRTKLKQLVERIKSRPTRSDGSVKFFYRFLGRYECDHLFEVRDRFWKIP